jgi:antirepressor protein
MRNINLQRVPFHEAEITSFQDGDGTVWVSLVRACESLDIEYNNQYKKITSSDLYRTQKFTYEGGSMLMMDAKGLTRWLMSIQPGKVKESSRDRLIRWQDESYEALRAYWFDGIALNPNATDEQKDAAAESFTKWFSARRIGIDTRKDFVSMIKTIGLAERYPDAYKRSTRDLYNRLFNNTAEDREEILAKFIEAKGQKTYVDPEGKRRSYNYRDTLSERQVAHLEDAERRIESVATGLHDVGIEPEEAYSRARDGVLRKMGNVTPF